MVSLNNPTSSKPDWTAVIDISTGFIAPKDGLLLWVVELNSSTKQGYAYVNGVEVGRGASNDYFRDGGACIVAQGDVLTTGGSANAKLIRFCPFK